MVSNEIQGENVWKRKRFLKDTDTTHSFMLMHIILFPLFLGFLSFFLSAFVFCCCRSSCSHCHKLKLTFFIDMKDETDSQWTTFNTPCFPGDLLIQFSQTIDRRIVMHFRYRSSFEIVTSHKCQLEEAWGSKTKQNLHNTDQHSYVNFYFMCKSSLS